MADNYNSNSSLKAAGVQIQFTPEQIAQYVKLSQDPNYFIDNYSKFQVIWNVNYNNHFIGEIYKDENERGYPWNYVCHHIGYYRRSGSRATEDAWKLGVKGLNPQIFNKFKNKT